MAQLVKNPLAMRETWIHSLDWGDLLEKIMGSGPITSWQTDVAAMETVKDFISLVSKITAEGDHSHEIKKCLLLGRQT